MCKRKDSSLCYYCKTQIETIEHLLFDCICVQRFWKDVSMYLQGYLDINQSLNKKDVIIGVKNSENDKLTNFVFLLVKRYIYVTRCIQKTLNLSAFINMLTEYCKLELLGARLKGNMSKFDVKWIPLKSLLLENDM